MAEELSQKQKIKEELAEVRERMRITSLIVQTYLAFGRCKQSLEKEFDDYMSREKELRCLLDKETT